MVNFHDLIKMSEEGWRLLVERSKAEAKKPPPAPRPADRLQKQ